MAYVKQHKFDHNFSIAPSKSVNQYNNIFNIETFLLKVTNTNIIL